MYQKLSSLKTLLRIRSRVLWLTRSYHFQERCRHVYTIKFVAHQVKKTRHRFYFWTVARAQPAFPRWTPSEMPCFRGRMHPTLASCVGPEHQSAAKTIIPPSLPVFPLYIISIIFIFLVSISVDGGNAIDSLVFLPKRSSNKESATLVASGPQGKITSFAFIFASNYPAVCAITEWSFVFLFFLCVSTQIDQS